MLSRKPPPARLLPAMAPLLETVLRSPPTQTLWLCAATLGMLLVTMATTFADATTADSTVHLTIEVQTLIATTPPTFLAHGWEPFTASGSFPDFKDPVFRMAFSHLRGQTVRFGGITANFLHYFEGAAESPPCDYGKYCRYCGGAECPFATASFDALLDFLSDAGVTVVFDFNELTGRNCTQPGPKPWQPPQFCGEAPATWNTTSVLLLLRHIERRQDRADRRRDRTDDLIFELGNEPFAPPHLTEETVAEDIAGFASLVRQVWGERAHPAIFAPGTNTCGRDDNGVVLQRLEGVIQGLSLHNCKVRSTTSARLFTCLFACCCL